MTSYSNSLELAQFTSLYQTLNQVHWQTRLRCSTQQDLSNSRINHRVISHPFVYPFHLKDKSTLEQIAVTHSFEIWDDQKPIHAVILLIHLCIVTELPIIRKGHRGDCSLTTLTWWGIPNRIPHELEELLLYHYKHNHFELVPLITCLTEFFLLNQEPLPYSKSHSPPYSPPHIPFLPFNPSSSPSS